MIGAVSPGDTGQVSTRMGLCKARPHPLSSMGPLDELQRKEGCQGAVPVPPEVPVPCHRPSCVWLSFLSPPSGVSVSLGWWLTRRASGRDARGPAWRPGDPALLRTPPRLALPARPSCHGLFTKLRLNRNGQRFLESGRACQGCGQGRAPPPPWPRCLTGQDHPHSPPTL